MTKMDLNIVAGWRTFDRGYQARKGPWEGMPSRLTEDTIDQVVAKMLEVQKRIRADDERDVFYPAWRPGERKRGEWTSAREHKKDSLEHGIIWSGDPEQVRLADWLVARSLAAGDRFPLLRGRAEDLRYTKGGYQVTTFNKQPYLTLFNYSSMPPPGLKVWKDLIEGHQEVLFIRGERPEGWVHPTADVCCAAEFMT